MLYFSTLKKWFVWLIVLIGLLAALPNVLPFSVRSHLPQFYANLHLPIGIDLRGGSRLVVRLPEDQLAQRNGVIAVMRERLAAKNFLDYSVLPQGSNAIRIEVPGVFDVRLIKDLLGITADISFFQLDERYDLAQIITGEQPIPAGDQLVYRFDEDPPIAYLLKSQAFIDSSMIAGARTRPDTSNSEQSLLQIDLNAQGLQRLAQLTTTPGQVLALVNDHEVINEIVFNEPITDGVILIADLDHEVADNFATILRTGPLPAPVTFIEERTLGADLGEDYAKTAFYAAIGALLVVALFMLVSYGFFGLVADFALLANLALLIGILSLLGTPLTLAGFAGLILVIGISVDANILIYERMREDRRNGFSLTQAISSGFSGALSTIIDANVTTFIAALLLFLLGTGPIHGFATVVTIGIATSLFTTVTFTRLLIAGWVKAFKPSEIPARLFRIIPINTSIPFMKIRSFTLGLAVVLSALVAVFWSLGGINYGIDFSGGSVAVLEARHGETDINDIAMRLDELNIGHYTLFEDANGKRVDVQIASQQLGEEAEQSVAIKLRNEFANDYDLQRLDVVGPSLSNALGQAGVLAIILSLAAIFAWVWLRFNWKFAIGAVLTTGHDILLICGLFIVLQWQFNLWCLAAILAIIGYSLNDTIVVYDRIRETLRKQPELPMRNVVDLAINRTLSRTILTSLVTLLAHIPLYYLGSPDLQSFAATLLLGVIFGTYSSIFIAGPLLVLLGGKRNKPI